MFTMVSDMLSAWAGLLVVMIAAILVILGAMVWIAFFRKNVRRRRRRRQHTDDRQPNPTLAQIGGLPPLRPNEKSAEPQTPTLTSHS